MILQYSFKDDVTNLLWSLQYIVFVDGGCSFIVLWLVIRNLIKDLKILDIQSMIRFCLRHIADVF